MAGKSRKARADADRQRVHALESDVARLEAEQSLISIQQARRLTDTSLVVALQVLRRTDSSLRARPNDAYDMETRDRAGRLVRRLRHLGTEIDRQEAGILARDVRKYEASKEFLPARKSRATASALLQRAERLTHSFDVLQGNDSRDPRVVQAVALVSELSIRLRAALKASPENLESPSGGPASATAKRASADAKKSRPRISSQTPESGASKPAERSPLVDRYEPFGPRSTWYYDDPVNSK